MIYDHIFLIDAVQKDLEGKSFLDHIKGKNNNKFDEIIYRILRKKTNMMEIIQSIPLEYSKIIYCPDSLRT